MISPPISGSAFLELPGEIRDRIYTYAIPQAEWKIFGAEYLDDVDLAGGIGDATSFYFPVRGDLSLMIVCKQIRREILPLVYHRTAFHLGDMDDFVRLAVSVGAVGRQNIESLGFAWQSRNDMEASTENEPGIGGPYSKLPTLHAERCVQLLWQLKSLSFLRLLFPEDLVSDKTDDELKVDPGINGLFSIRGIQKVEIRNKDGKSLENHSVLRELQEKMKSSND